MKITKTMAKFLEVLRSAGALENPVDWRALKVNGNALKSLIERGIVVPPAGEKFGYRSGYCYGNGPVPTKLVRLDPEKVAAAAVPADAKPAKKTCPCCFRAMTVKSGKVVRHGWKEIGGGYGRGRGWHSGSCWGVGFPPFEVSTEGTESLLAKLVDDVVPAAEAELARLEARPAKITFSYRGVCPETRRYTDLMRTLEDDGVALDEVENLYSGRDRSYAYQLSRKIAAEKRYLDSLRKDVETLRKAIADWKPAEG
jgi:hypothetical protein